MMARRRRKRGQFATWMSRSARTGAAGFCAPTVVDYHHFTEHLAAGDVVTHTNWVCAGVAALVVLVSPVVVRVWRMPRPGRVITLNMRSPRFEAKLLAAPKGHVLYRFTASRVLVYLGITSDPWRRFSQHAGVYSGCEQKSWWGEVTQVTLTYYRTRDDLEEAERRAIHAEHPRENIAHNGVTVTRATRRGVMARGRR